MSNNPIESMRRILDSAQLSCVSGGGQPFVKVQFSSLDDAQEFHKTLAQMKQEHSGSLSKVVCETCGRFAPLVEGKCRNCNPEGFASINA